MKILLGVPEYPPFHIGGGGVVFKDLAENYIKLGHEVVVIYGYYPTKSWFEDIKEYTNENKIKFYQIPEIPYPKSAPFLRTVMPCNLKSYFKLKKIIKEEKPDVAHLHGYGLIFINITSFILKRFKIKYIFTIHGYPETQKKNFFLRLIWYFYKVIIMNSTLRNAKHITCVSSFIKQDKRNIFPEKSSVIYNGINFADYQEVKNDINIRRKHVLSDNCLILFSLGRISEMKGFQEIIKILPQLISKGIDVKYLIAGEDDGFKKELDSLINELNLDKNVEFVGFLDLETKKQYLKQCDIFAIPSLWEPFGLVALEGMIYNKIILASDRGGLKEVLENYDNKVFLSEKDFINKILTLKTAPLDDKILQKFNYSSIAETYLKML